MSKRKQNKTRNFTGLGEHIRQGKSLVAPMAQLPNMGFSSWKDERLPEMLWASLLVTFLPRGEALAVFRAVAEWVAKYRDQEPPVDITHTGIGRLAPDRASELTKVVVQHCGGARYILRPLLLLRELPARTSWESAIADLPVTDDWHLLMRAVARVLDHQSQEATDCRWLRVICLMAGDKVRFVGPLEESAKEMLYYPDYGDQRKVRPSIRAFEISMGRESWDRAWSNSFWAQCLSDTNCIPWPNEDTQVITVGTTSDQVRRVFLALGDYCQASTATTAVDPRHDTVFGASLYGLALLEELLRVGASQSVSGRLVLRALAEVLITLSFLVKKDDSSLWKSYRVFGAGQAKLQFLKLADLDDAVHYVSADTLHELANEDVWQEFLNIDLGHWNKSDLRSLSIEAGCKDIYDRYYSWTSSFVHGHWGSIRDTVFDSCANPLHRLHRIPRGNARRLPDLLPDACLLVDGLLDALSMAYPTFTERVSIHTTTY